MHRVFSRLPVGILSSVSYRSSGTQIAARTRYFHVEAISTLPLKNLATSDPRVYKLQTPKFLVPSPTTTTTMPAINSVNSGLKKKEKVVIVGSGNWFVLEFFLTSLPYDSFYRFAGDLLLLVSLVGSLSNEFLDRILTLFL